MTYSCRCMSIVPRRYGDHRTGPGSGHGRPCLCTITGFDHYAEEEEPQDQARYQGLFCYSLIGMAERSYDLVLFGATGFTGGLSAEYLARNVPPGCRWALAGRNQLKLEAVRDRLVAIDPALSELPLLTADITDSGSLRAVAEGARVVVTTVGPYALYGEPLVAACVAAGTDY